MNYAEHGDQVCCGKFIPNILKYEHLKNIDQICEYSNKCFLCSPLCNCLYKYMNEIIFSLAIIPYDTDYFDTKHAHAPATVLELMQ